MAGAGGCGVATGLGVAASPRSCGAGGCGVAAGLRPCHGAAVTPRGCGVRDGFLLDFLPCAAIVFSYLSRIFGGFSKARPDFQRLGSIFAG